MQLEIFLVFFITGLAEYFLGEFVMWLRMKDREVRYVKLIKEKLKEKGIEEL